MTKIFIASPSSRPVNVYTYNSLMWNIHELGLAGIEIEEPRSYEEYPLSRARNEALYDFYFVYRDCDLFFFWDDDTVFKKGDLLRLVESCKKYPIVSGWYMARKGNLGLVVFGRHDEKELLNPSDFNYYYPLQAKDLLETRRVDEDHSLVDGVGMGGVMMTREAVGELFSASEDSEKPIYAEWHPLMSEEVHEFGEDLWFSDMCAFAGLPIHVNTKCFFGHWAAQGFVIGKKHFGSMAMQQGYKNFNINEI